jgi:zinc transport system ATP-binding protein
MQDNLVISVRNLGFHYPNLPSIFEGVSFFVNQGEFISLVGSNGSGKTTLIKILLGILKPTSGEIEFFGQTQKDFLAKTINHSKIAYIPQTATQPREFPITVKELLDISIIIPKTHKNQLEKLKSIFGLELSGYNTDLITKITSTLKIKNLVNKELSDLSGGERQKVYIARAIINNPQLIFLDEPTSGIDQLSEKEFFEIIDTLRREFNTTIIMITHDISGISHRVDRIFCLSKTLEVIDNPKDYTSSQHIHILSHTHQHNHQH